MGAPVVIGVAGGRRDREVASALLRTVLDADEPYGRAGIVGARELHDGAEWKRRPNLAHELERIDSHVRNAADAGLPFLVVELDEAAERGTNRLDVLCTIGAGGAGTARAGGRGLSFSARGAIADVGASHMESHYGYVQFQAHTPEWEACLALPVTGLFNLGPALGVVATSALLGIDIAQIASGLLHARVPGHGDLLFSPDHRVFALVEESRARRDAERLVAAAREEYGGLRLEVVRGAGAVPDAVARAYGAPGGERSMLVLLGDSSEALEDAFQAAVRAHARLG